MCSRSDEPHDQQTATCDDLMEDALDAVFAPLVDIVPIAERRSMRAEMRAHILTLATDYGNATVDPVPAMHGALARFGAPHRIARQIAETRAGRIRRAFGPGSMLAAGLCGAVIGSNAPLLPLWLNHVAPNPNGAEAWTGAVFGLLVGFAARRLQTSPLRTAIGAAVAAGGAFLLAVTIANLTELGSVHRLLQFAWIVSLATAVVSATAAIAGAAIGSACRVLARLDRYSEVDHGRGLTA